jgi:hypothetical protein
MMKCSVFWRKQPWYKWYKTKPVSVETEVTTITSDRTAGVPGEIKPGTFQLYIRRISTAILLGRIV